ncbi:MAG: nitroreductase family deazaflavin-dependent oxidoreductase [Chloroflexi bacterium]|nr:nitroreductase family deazaflavin-dependent oxidoreductase [Chloroflexota bacterium]
MTQAPALVRISNPLTRRLLRVGLPMGPNVLMTVRGRASGLPRSAPVAIVELDGRRWVIGAYGNVHWVQNLRATGEADLRLHGRTVHVAARELEGAAAVAFYRDTLPAFIARLPWVGRLLARGFLGTIAGHILREPEIAAARHPVFELSGER